MTNIRSDKQQAMETQLIAENARLEKELKLHRLTVQRLYKENQQAYRKIRAMREEFNAKIRKMEELIEKLKLI